MNRIHLIFLVLLICSPLGLIGVSSQAFAAQIAPSPCAFKIDSKAFSCRTFASTSGSTAYSFEIYWFKHGSDYAFTALGIFMLGPQVKGNDDTKLIESDHTFGEFSVAFESPGGLQGVEENQNVTVAFQEGEYVAVWTASDSTLDPLELLWDLYRRQRDTWPWESSQLFGYLFPGPDDLPGFTVVAEDVTFAPVFPPRERPSGGGEETGATDTAASVDDQQDKDGDLEVIRVDARDAGVGDGSIYVYADIHNGTTDLYTTVILSAVCKDAVGSTVGTGVGVLQNLQPGETVTATIIILSVPACSDYSVRIDSAIE